MIYNREEKTFYNEKQNMALKFFYHTMLGRTFLKVAISKPISKVGGMYMNSRISTLKIRKFIRKNKIDMSEYPLENYKSFDDFFIRKIKDGKRPISKNRNDLISPADSKLTVAKIDSKTKLNIKNSIYTVDELIKDEKITKEYKNGYCLVFRLDVDDYHHYHFIDNGKVLFSKKINGVLHTVNPIAYKKYKVYSENSREWSILETENFGQVIQIEVGALMVGRIKNKPISKFKRGQEKGYFCFGGSTVIMLFKENTIEIDEDIISNSKKQIETKIKCGEKIGRKK